MRDARGGISALTYWAAGRMRGLVAAAGWATVSLPVDGGHTAGGAQANVWARRRTCGRTPNAR